VPDEKPRRGVGLLLGLALVYLGAEIFASAAKIGDATEVSVMIATVAQALPAVVEATLVAGAALGLFAASHPRLVGSGTTRRRLAIGAIAGAVIGVVIGAGILLTFGASGGIGVLAATLLVAAVLGGLAAALPPPVLGALLAGVVSGLIVAIVLSLFDLPLVVALGGGHDAAALRRGAILLSFLSALLEGVAAAVVAYRFLRARGSGRPWPWYLLAGAGYGLVGLATIVVSRVGGSGLYGLVQGFSADDAAYLDYVLESTLRAALVSGFVGGIGAMIAVGRTLSSSPR